MLSESKTRLRNIREKLSIEKMRSDSWPKWDLKVSDGLSWDIQDLKSMLINQSLSGPFKSLSKRLWKDLRRLKHWKSKLSTDISMIGNLKKNVDN